MSFTRVKRPPSWSPAWRCWRRWPGLGLAIFVWCDQGASFVYQHPLTAASLGIGQMSFLLPRQLPGHLYSSVHSNQTQLFWLSSCSHSGCCKGGWWLSPLSTSRGCSACHQAVPMMPEGLAVEDIHFLTSFLCIRDCHELFPDDHLQLHKWCLHDHLLGGIGKNYQVLAESHLCDFIRDPLSTVSLEL